MRFLLLLVLILFPGCVNDPGLNKVEKYELQTLKKAWRGDNSRNNMIYHVISDNPEMLAQKAVKENDYRLIGVAGGYMASEEDIEPLAVTCNVEVEQNPVVFGCVGIPDVVLKQMIRYNKAMISMPSSPYAGACSMDEEVVQKMDDMSKIQIQNVEQRYTINNAKWLEKRAYLNEYNN